MLSTPFGNILMTLDEAAAAFSWVRVENRRLAQSPHRGNDIQTWFAADPTITAASVQYE